MLPDTEVGLETPRDRVEYLSVLISQTISTGGEEAPGDKGLGGGWQHRCADEGREGVLWVPWPVHRGV